MRSRFPNNEDRRSFRVRRPLSKPSRRAIWYCEDLPQVFPQDGLRSLHRETDLTIIGKMDIVDARHAVPRLGQMLFKDLAQELLEPKPPTADQNLLLKAKHIGYIGTKKVVRAALFLDDRDQALANEYGVYTERLDTIGVNGRWKGMLPHISLALVPREAATNELLTWLESKAPEEVMLMPVTTDPRIPSQ